MGLVGRMESESARALMDRREPAKRVASVDRLEVALAREDVDRGHTDARSNTRWLATNWSATGPTERASRGEHPAAALTFVRFR
jgi:hypothetical protein